MNMTLDTRYSLLLRVGNPADGRAWGEFWQLYQPVVYRLALPDQRSATSMGNFAHPLPIESGRIGEASL